MIIFVIINFKYEGDFMSFDYYIDGITFKFNENMTLEYIDDIAFDYSLERVNAYNSQIICDCDALTSYIIENLKVKMPEFQVYDLSQCKSNQLGELVEMISKGPLLVYGIEKYLDFLQKEFYNNRMFSLFGKEYTEAQRRFYTAIEMGRDSFFLAKKTKVIFLMSNCEYNAFLNLADDFASYYPTCFDFNKTLLASEGFDGSLFEYLNFHKKGLRLVKKDWMKDTKSE